MFKRALIATTIAFVFFASGILAFATPWPFIFLFTKCSRRIGWLSVVAAFAVAFAVYTFNRFNSNPFEIVYFGYFLFVAVLLGEGAVRRWGILKLSMVAVFVPCLMAGVALFSSGPSAVLDIRSSLTAIMQQALGMEETKRAMSAIQFAYLKEHLVEIVNFSLWVLPSVVLLFSMLVVALAILFGRTFPKGKAPFSYLGNVVTLQFPFWLVWVTIVGSAVFLANSYALKDTVIKFAAINCLIFCAGVYFIQGCLIIAFWLKKGRSPVFRFIVYGMIVFFLQAVGFFIIALGLSDHWMNFRKRMVLSGGEMK